VVVVLDGFRKICQGLSYELNQGFLV
jgi:hypothetical protein